MFPEFLFFVLFPKIFYFLVGILSVFATWCSLLRLHYKYRQSAPQYNTICIGSNNRFGLKSILFKLNAIIFLAFVLLEVKPMPGYGYIQSNKTHSQL